MAILVFQIVILCLVAAAIVLWGLYFPYPSPLVRRWLPPRKRWPERQIRSWLKSGRFQRAFLGHFYSDPERMAPVGNTMLAPADGLVTSTDERGGIRYLVIALSFWDMHVQRSPVAGRVVSVTSHGDDFMDGEGREFAFLREKSCPVQKRLVIVTDAGQVAVRLITSLAARRIETWVQEGEEIERGQRIGRILLGSTVVLELPARVKMLVRIWGSSLGRRNRRCGRIGISMSGFLWTSGHLGWGIFAIGVFTGLWLLLTDLYWRLKRIRIGRLLAKVAAGWIIGVGLIMLAFWFLRH